MKIYITRHSKTIWNQEHRLQGWKDSPLTNEGIRDALFLKERMKEIPIDVCYSSPITRARKTADLVFGKTIPIIEDSRLKELHFGDFEGRKVNSLKKHQVYQDLWHQPYPSLALPNGESLESVFARLHSFLKDIYVLHSEDTVFLTVHGMIVIFILTIANELPIEKMTEVNTVMRGCSLSYLEYDGQHFTIHYVGEDSHLPEITQAIAYQG